MKTLNLFISSLIITTSIFLAGCLPDSLTKNKSDAEEKPAAVVDNGIISGDDGSEIHVDDIIQITSNGFYMKNSENRKSPFYVELNNDVDFSLFINGTYGIASAKLKQKLFRGCTVTPNLPYGLYLDSTAENPCQIKGKALAHSSNIGEGVDYVATLKTISTGGVIQNISTSFKIGIFEKPTSFTYDEPTKIIIKSDSISEQAIANSDDNKAPYSPFGFVSQIDGTTGVIKAIDRELSKISIHKIIDLTLHQISSPGGLASIATLPVGLISTSQNIPYFLCDNRGTKARIINVSSNKRNLSVEMISHKHFQETDIQALGFNDVAITNDLDNCNSTSLNLFVASVNKLAKFKEQMDLDYYQVYQTSASKVSSIEFTYEIDKKLGTDVNDYPILEINSADLTKTELSSTINGINFTISPPLPTGLNFGADGSISGDITSVIKSGIYTVTASNKVGSVSTKIILNTDYAPTDLSYTQNQLLSVNQHYDFDNGLKIRQSPASIIPLNPDLVKKGTVINKYYNPIEGTYANRISILNTEGIFNSGDYFISPTTTQSNLPYVLNQPVSSGAMRQLVTNFNIALNFTNSTDLTGFDVGKYITTNRASNNALARIVYKYEPAGSARKVLFVQSLLQEGENLIYPFAQDTDPSNNICVIENKNDTCVESITSPVQILSLETNNLLGTFGAPLDIDHVDYSFGTTGVYVTPFDLASNTYLLSEITRKPESAATPTSPYPTATEFNIVSTPSTGEYEEITPTTSDIRYASLAMVFDAANIFIVERNRPVNIFANVNKGSSLTFSISPELPAGLEINPNTGIISGKASSRTNLSQYKITAMNLIGKTEYIIYLEVRDYLKLENNSLPYDSYLHFAGPNKELRDCKIDANAIIKHSNTLNVFKACYLDIEEQDLASFGLKLKASIGKNVCSHSVLTPASHFQYAPISSSKTVAVLSETCNSSSITFPVFSEEPTPADFCDGNYINLDGPNCDEGFFTVRTYNPGSLPSDPCVFTGSKIVRCGGKKLSCLNGHIKGIIPEESYSEGVNKVILSDSNSSYGEMEREYTLNSIVAEGERTVLRLTNHFPQSSCDPSDFRNTNILVDKVQDISSDSSPLSKDTNPYTSLTCHDGASEVKAAIRLIVRDWDRKFNIRSGIDQFLPATLYNDSTIDPVSASPYNSVASWDNRLSDWTEAACTIASPPSLPYDFPGSDY